MEVRHDPTGTADTQLDRSGSHDLPAGAGGAGGHHTVQRGGAYFQPDEKGLHRRKGLHRDPQPLRHGGGRYEHGHRRLAR